MFQQNDNAYGNVSYALTASHILHSLGKRMKLSNNKDLNSLLKSAQTQGWDFSVNKNHIKGRHLNGQTATISRTPSDGRAFKNILHDLRVKNEPK